MSHSPDGTDARTEFAQAVQTAMGRAAREGKTRPTLTKISKASAARGRTQVSVSSISAWQKGDRVPASWAVLASFLDALEIAASLPRGRFDRRAWQRLHDRARNSSTVSRHSRVAVFAVRDADPLELKVHRARTMENGDAVPTYIPRDIDPAVRGALSRAASEGGVILLIGDSTSGKTRCAYEAMTAILPDRPLIVPPYVTDLADAVTEAVSTARSGAPGVLWLNDMEQYLGPDGLTLGDIRALRSAHIVVLGTMRSRIRANLPSHELVRLSEEFEVPRLWSLEERERTREHLRSQPDARLSLALDQAENFGIAETLATGPQLWRELNSASVVDGNPRGAAIVWAAIDLALAGLTEPQPVELLKDLHERYLPGLNKQLISPEPFDTALAWTTTPRDSVTRLLIPEDEGLKPFDYLLDAHLRDRGPSPELIPDEIWSVALERGTLDHQRFSIALAAHANNRMDIGRRALQPLADARDVDAFRTLGLLYERTDTEEAIGWLKHAIDAGDVLSLRLMGNLHFRKQDGDSADMWYQQAAKAGDKVSQSHYNSPQPDWRPVPDELAPPPRPEAEAEEDWDDEREFDLSPRTLLLLEATFEILADMAYDTLEEVGGLPVDLHQNGAFIFSDMPVITWRQGIEWRLQMVRCFDDLADDIRAGNWPKPTCTGEEMALHLAISHASSMVVDEPEFVTSVVEGVPPHHDDWDWGLCMTMLLDDTDVLFLYEPWSQGVEKSDHFVNQRLGIANLESEDWFTPFYDGSDRDPNRGLRELPAALPGNPAHHL